MNRKKPDHDLMNITAGKFNTYSGKVADILNPTSDMIDVRDIAQGLANLCRFGGQIPEIYSVAHHSLHVALLAPDELTRECLIHDASEAYIGDVIKPLKVILGKAYTDIEERWMRVICEVFEVDYDRLELVKQYDILALKYEFAHFFEGVDQPSVRSIRAYRNSNTAYSAAISLHFSDIADKLIKP